MNCSFDVIAAQPAEVQPFAELKLHVAPIGLASLGPERTVR